MVQLHPRNIHSTANETMHDLCQNFVRRRVGKLVTASLENDRYRERVRTRTSLHHGSPACGLRRRRAACSHSSRVVLVPYRVRG